MKFSLVPLLVPHREQFPEFHCCLTSAEAKRRAAPDADTRGAPPLSRVTGRGHSGWDHSPPQTPAMAAAAWTVRGRKTAADLGTVVRSTSTHTALKAQYDALVIGGGEICAENTGANRKV